LEIRNKLTLQFSILVAFLLLAILSFNYLLAYRFAQESFLERLKQRAIVIADFQTEAANDYKLYSNSQVSRNLSNESFRAFSSEGKLVFSFGDARWRPDNHMMKSLKKQQEFVEIESGVYSICFPIESGKEKIWILASAWDEVGSSKLRNMANSMGISFLVFLVFIVLAGR
jgi:hypothetical protein